MAIRLPSGLWASTGVAAESTAHKFAESPANQRNEFFQTGSSFNFGFAYNGLYAYRQDWDSVGGGPGPTASMVNMCSDGSYVGWIYAYSISQAYGFADLGTTDARGYEMTSPPPAQFATTFTGGTPVWSGQNSSGSPYWATSKWAGKTQASAQVSNSESDSGPFGTWVSPNNVTAKCNDYTWYKKGTYTFNLVLSELGGFTPPGAPSLVGWANGSPDTVLLTSYGAQNAFTVTLNFGGNVVTGNPATGWSGTGVTGNTNTWSSISPGRNWVATITVTFAGYWQFSGTFGPIDFTSTGTAANIGGSLRPVPTGPLLCGFCFVNVYT